MCQRGVLSDIGSPEGAPYRSLQIPPCCANSDVFPYLPSSGIEYNPEVFEQDRLSTYTGLNDYDTLFKARHGRGAIDNMPKSGERACAASSMGMATTTSSRGYDRKSYGWGKTKTYPRQWAPTP